MLAVWRLVDDTPRGAAAARREMHRLVPIGSTARVLRQQEAMANALADVLRLMPPAALREPGGEEDWNAAQAFAHATAARRFLVTWAAMAAAAEWPTQDPPRATAGIPGPPDASVDQLLSLLQKSRDAQRAASEKLAGHETDRCDLEGTPIGQLRCGEWLLWVGVHDLMHLEQLHRIVERHAAPIGHRPASGEAAQ